MKPSLQHGEQVIQEVGRAMAVMKPSLKCGEDDVQEVGGAMVVEQNAQKGLPYPCRRMLAPALPTIK